MHPTITGTLTLCPSHAPGSLHSVHRVARQATAARLKTLAQEDVKGVQGQGWPGQRAIHQHRTARAHARRDQLRGRAAHRIQRRVRAAAACSGSIQGITFIRIRLTTGCDQLCCTAHHLRAAVISLGSCCMLNCVACLPDVSRWVVALATRRAPRLRRAGLPGPHHVMPGLIQACDMISVLLHLQRYKC